MPIAIVCPKCGAQFRVGDARIGTKIRCQACGQGIVAGGQSDAHDERDEPDEAPSKEKPVKRRISDDDSCRPRRLRAERRTSPLIWMIAGGGAVFLLLVVVIVVMLMSRENAGVQPNPVVPVVGGAVPKDEPPPLNPEELALQKKAEKIEAIPLPADLPVAKRTDLNGVALLKLAPAPWAVDPDSEEEPPAADLPEKLPLSVDSVHVRRI